MNINVNIEDSNMTQSLQQKIEQSISLLRKSEALALKYNPEDGFYLAFSGGKDSQALYHIAQMAGVKFRAHMNLTSIDPPQVIRFVKTHYPDVVRHAPKKSIYQYAIERQLLPTRIVRWCCQELKEGGGSGQVTLTGVRKAESINRSKRREVEVSSHKYAGDLEGFSDWQTKTVRKKYKNLNQDQFSEQGETEVRCVGGKDKIIINPIIDWTDQDVWEFLNDVVKVPHCSLYDEGLHRIGCILCPMSNYKQKLKDIASFPHVKRKWIETIKQLRKIHCGGVITARTGGAYICHPEQAYWLGIQRTLGRGF